MGCSSADQCDVLCQQVVWPPDWCPLDWCQSRPSDLGNTHSDRRSRDPFGSVLGVFSRTSASYNHRHTRSSWIPAPIPPNHPTSHPWGLQGSCLGVVDTGGNTSWLELLRPSLELHDERPGTPQGHFRRGHVTAGHYGCCPNLLTYHSVQVY
jgi:hypothetical protein